MASGICSSVQANANISFWRYTLESVGKMKKSQRKRKWQTCRKKRERIFPSFDMFLNINSTNISNINISAKSTERRDLSRDAAIRKKAKTFSFSPRPNSSEVWNSELSEKWSCLRGGICAASIASCLRNMPHKYDYLWLILRRCLFSFEDSKRKMLLYNLRQHAYLIIHSREEIFNYCWWFLQEYHTYTRIYTQISSQIFRQ